MVILSADDWVFLCCSYRSGVLVVVVVMVTVVCVCFDGGAGRTVIC